MREALNGVDVINFDTEDVEDEIDSQAQQSYQELMEEDKELLTALWRGMQQTGLIHEPQLQMDYLMFNLARTGFDHPQADVEKTLGRWINYRMGQEVTTLKIARLFNPAQPDGSA